MMQGVVEGELYFPYDGEGANWWQSLIFYTVVGLLIWWLS